MPLPADTGTPAVVRAVQERAARAQPAERVETVEGWLLRHAPGCSWWLSAALPHGGVVPGGLERGIARAEDFYARCGATAAFQITPGVCPAGLDTVLAARGYTRRGSLSLQAAATSAVRGREPTPPLRVRVDDRPAPAWFGAWAAVHGYTAESAIPEKAMLARVRGPSAYARAVTGNGTVAVGRAVAEAGWAGVFSMATLPEARGGGAAGRVLAALAEWARQQGADRMYLQVERDNAAALRLYERAGFAEVCGYHYRTARCSGRRSASGSSPRRARRGWC
ncbi:GNAT family N-acetyltransferase [Streptomonospora salina]|uniref:GNAT superfamily N-acetyltransferase n=1 Tax=Streptomonospora salina TaxID=104205 RepID=A0A841E9J6_9ACTN|nr:GNAT family N-acetyltransferase [Streptomonospora salina]MBB5997180.1 GNAT superfamily N-acetyltransferase [Streptomonospora salina]